MQKDPKSEAADTGTDEPAQPRTYRPEDDAPEADRPKEIGGRKGPEPTRYGDWEKNGRCIDF